MSQQMFILGNNLVICRQLIPAVHRAWLIESYKKVSDMIKNTPLSSQEQDLLKEKGIFDYGIVGKDNDKKLK